MAKIKVKRGVEANIGSVVLDDGEFAITTDTKKLYVGIAGAKICVGGASSLGDMLKSIYDTDNDGIVDSSENSDMLDGKHSIDFATSIQGAKADNALPSSSYTAIDVLTKIKTADGSGSGLDSDLLDGQEGSYYLNYNNINNKPTIPTTLPANGGNADMLDGKHAIDFAPSGFGLGNVCQTATVDWNNYKAATGFYMGSGLLNECPGISWRFCIVMRHNDIWTSQTMIDFQGTAIYQRNQVNGVWGAWRKILASKQGITWDDLRGV